MRRLDSMNKRGAVMNRGKAARTEQRVAKEFLVAMRLRDTPVLIPNTMVKT